MKKKYYLRSHFTLKQGRDLFKGPCVVELTAEEAKANKHKLDEVPNEPHAEPEAKKKK